MNEVAIEHLESFIDEFVPITYKEEWKSLLRLQPPKLESIEPYDIWPENDEEIANCSILNVSFHEFIRNEPYMKYRDHKVVVIPCGHDDNNPIVLPLKNVLDGSYYLLEGIISIVKGELALMINHDGEACIFNKMKNT